MTKTPKGCASLRAALKKCEELGCIVYKKNRTGEWVVISKTRRLLIGTRKDCPRVLAKLLEDLLKGKGI